MLEPSSLYPLRIFLNPLNKVMGNVTGKVPTERPLSPVKLRSDLLKSGFTKIKIVGQTFNHVRIPVLVQFLVNMIDYPFRHLSPFCYFSETIGFFAEKGNVVK